MTCKIGKIPFELATLPSVRKLLLTEKSDLVAKMLSPIALARQAQRDRDQEQDMVVGIGYRARAHTDRSASVGCAEDGDFVADALALGAGIDAGTGAVVSTIGGDAAGTGTESTANQTALEVALAAVEAQMLQQEQEQGRGVYFSFSHLRGVQHGADAADALALPAADRPGSNDAGKEFAYGAMVGKWEEKADGEEGGDDASYATGTESESGADYCTGDSTPTALLTPDRDRAGGGGGLRTIKGADSGTGNGKGGAVPGSSMSIIAAAGAGSGVGSARSIARSSGSGGTSDVDYTERTADLSVDVDIDVDRDARAGGIAGGGGLEIPSPTDYKKHAGVPLLDLSRIRTKPVSSPVLMRSAVCGSAGTGATSVSHSSHIRSHLVPNPPDSNVATLAALAVLDGDTAYKGGAFAPVAASSAIGSVSSHENHAPTSDAGAPAASHGHTGRHSHNEQAPDLILYRCVSNFLSCMLCMEHYTSGEFTLTAAPPTLSPLPSAPAFSPRTHSVPVATGRTPRNPMTWPSRPAAALLQLAQPVLKRKSLL